MQKKLIIQRTSTQKYILSLILLSSFIGVFSVSTYTMLYKLLSQQKRNFEVINASNKHRILSQKAGLITLQLINSRNNKEKGRLKLILRNTARDLRKSHEFIVKNFVYIKTDANKNLLKELDYEVKRILNQVTSFLDPQRDNSISVAPQIKRFLTVIEKQIPIHINQTVFFFEKLAHKETTRTQMILAVLIACILFLILYGALVIFYPMIQHIKVERIKLIASHNRLDAIINGAVNGIITITKRGIIESVNPNGEKIFQYNENEMVGKNIKFLMPSPFKEEHDGYLSNYLKTNKPRIIGIGREVMGLRKDGTIFPMFLSVSESLLEGKVFFTGFVQDITKLKEAQEEIQNLSLDIIKVQEDERDRISREIHDDLGTSIALVKMMIQSSYVKIKKRYNIVNNVVEPESTEIVEYLNTIAETARHLSHTLSPVGMKGLGICIAIEKLVKKIKDNSDIKVTMELSPLKDFFTDNWDINLYRIMQESLINMHKHANAKTAKITTKLITNNRLILTIEDDGRGIDQSKVKLGLGMSLMKQRASLMNANIAFTSKLGQGTKITLEINK